MKDVHELEIFAPINDFPDYLITSHGRVLSLKGGKIKEMKLQKHSNGRGYLNVTLMKNNKPKTLSVHRLVAQAFIPNPYIKSDVNHIDENPSNNYVSNLEWTTHEDNLNYGNRIKKHKNLFQRK